MFEIDNKNTRMSLRSFWCFYFFNFEHGSHLFLLFLLLTLNKKMLVGKRSIIANFFTKTI